MNLGNIVRRAASAFGKSKSRGGAKTATTGATGASRTTGSGSSPKADLAKSAAKVAKKKL